VDANLGPGNLVDEDENFIGDNTGAAQSFVAGTPNARSSWVGTAGAALNPLLGALADNGGTMVLPDGSHLLTMQDDANNGPDGLRGRAPQGLPFDERNFPVAAGSTRDIGAYQFQDCDLFASVVPAGPPLRVGQPATFTLAVTNFGPNACPFDPVLTATLPTGTMVVAASGNATARGNVVTFLVPPLAVNGSASFTLTVLPAAPGLFTVTAAVSTHDDPDVSNNTESGSLTVQPQAVPATGAADVTDLVKIVPLVGRHRRPQKRLFFLLTNVSSTPIQGPMGVVVPGLHPRRGPRLLDASGTTAGGQKFVLVNLGGDDICDPGASTMVELAFSQPFRPRTLDVLAGAFTQDGPVGASG
jgi:uncharacterized repeat protein (TIGR01451 family)